jgi:hypothetical protein
VEVEYVENAREAFGSQPGNPNPSAFFTTNSRKMKCNDSLREDYCRWFYARERNCEHDDYAQRYCLGYLSGT